MARTGVRVGVVGLGFGAAFVPIYLRHPDVARVLLCDPNEERLQQVGDRFGLPDRFRRLEHLTRTYSLGSHLKQRGASIEARRREIDKRPRCARAHVDVADHVEA